jgi:sn-glycerol 3-phosphate transport system substrate-binding protein
MLGASMRTGRVRDGRGRRIPRRALGTGAAALATGALGCGRRPVLAPGEITFWFSYGGKNREVLLDLVAEFHRVQHEVRVRAVFQGDYFENLAKLRTALFVGRAPTVTHVVGEVVPYLDAAGVLAPLEEIGEERIDDLVPALSQAGTFESGGERPLVALPFNRSTPICYFDRDLFAALGLAPPRTWEELRSVARRATLRDGGETARWGFECPVDTWFWVALVGQAGGRLVEDGAFSLGGEAGVRALSLWQAMVHADRTMKPPPGRDYNAWEATNVDYLAGRTAMIWTSTAFVRYLEDKARFRVGAAPLPSDVRAAVPTGGTFFVMPRGAPEPERRAGLTFLRWMMEPAQAAAWASRTGYIPTSTAALAALERQGFYADHANDRVAVDQLAQAQRWPWRPELFRVQRETLQPLLEEAVLGPRDAHGTLSEARRAAREG